MTDNLLSRFGFVVLAGAPNAGKSTLLNKLVGTKVSIVSPKAQTTRSRILGIGIEGNTQLVLVDTPGIFSNAKRRLERAMVSSAWSNLETADIAVLLVDASVGRILGEAVCAIIAKLPRRDDGSPSRPIFLVLNKIDAVERSVLLTLTDIANKLYPFTATFMVSALSGDGVSDLKSHLASQLPEGPWLYPEDQLADLPLRLMTAEFTREQIFLQLRDELPYSTTVETEVWQERADGSVRIEQTVIVMREGQKAIVLGNGGQRIKQIGSSARAVIGDFLGRSVHLFLHVKVRDDWIHDPAYYKTFGLDWRS